MKAIPYFILCAIRNSKSLYSYKQIIKTHRDDLNPIFIIIANNYIPTRVHFVTKRYSYKHYAQCCNGSLQY
ncbi:hypothetical protein D5G43_12385 [Salmonella enterica subsp. enterica serovar Mbandaka]|nr:hypothetical protein D5G43_12385 [Salmonella enterica subsp. enterica serovar Mbandaka]